jgi:protein-tyrosine phosphatase
MHFAHKILLTGLLSFALSTAASAHVANADVQRAGPDQVTISWSDADPVDIYAGDRPDFPLTSAATVLHDSRAGHFEVDHAGTARRYFILVDQRDQTRVEVAERLVPLAQGSNFRDIGGYAAAGGKHVRWGLIYRSGAQPMLTTADVDAVHALGITQLVDLRSDEERLVAPTRINGVPYAAVGYAMSDIMKGAAGTKMHNGADIYRNFPLLLAPQLKLVFAHLLHERAPIVYNCSAGQDRTGFVTAMILTALGVDYDTIVADYHLSTRYRRPEFEMPPFDPALAASNPGLQMFAAWRTRPDWKTPQPLMDKDGQPFLRGAFDAIKDKWGSVDAYLQQDVGVGPAQIAQLRREYLE